MALPSAFASSVTEERWTEMLNESSDATFFQTPNWARILTEVYGYHAATQIFETKEGDVLFPMMEMQRFGLRALASMPFGYGGVLPSTTSSETIREIIASLLRGRRLRLYISLSPTSTPSIPVSANIERRSTDWDYAHLLDLTGGSEAVIGRMGKNIRRDVGRAGKLGVEVEPVDSLEGYHEFYKIYAGRSKEWGYAEPPYPLTLFEAVYRHARSYAHLNLAKRDGETIGGEISFSYGNVPFGWMLAVTKENSRYNAGSLLQYHAILDVCENGSPVFNMGSSGPLESVRNYKKRWGAVEVAVPSYICRSKLDRLLHPVQRRIRSMRDKITRQNRDPLLETQAE